MYPGTGSRTPHRPLAPGKLVAVGKEPGVLQLAVRHSARVSARITVEVCNRWEARVHEAK